MCCKQCRDTEQIYKERAKKEGLTFYKYNCVYYEKESFKRKQEKGEIPNNSVFVVLG